MLGFRRKPQFGNYRFPSGVIRGHQQGSPQYGPLLCRECNPAHLLPSRNSLIDFGEINNNYFSFLKKTFNVHTVTPSLHVAGAAILTGAISIKRSGRYKSGRGIFFIVILSKKMGEKQKKPS